MDNIESNLREIESCTIIAQTRMRQCQIGNTILCCRLKSTMTRLDTLRHVIVKTPPPNLATQYRHAMQSHNASQQVPPAYYPQEQQDGPHRGMCERNTLEEAAGAQDISVFGPEAAKAVAVDIETSGLDANCSITAVALVGQDWSVCYTFGPMDDFCANKAAIVTILNHAPLIYAFNAPDFDFPVMKRCFQLDNNTIGSWMAKLVDPLYAAKALYGTKLCAKLDLILTLNGLPSKTGSGLDAVHMAREGRWEELAAYCTHDTEVTRRLVGSQIVYWTEGMRFEALSSRVWVNSASPGASRA